MWSKLQVSRPVIKVMVSISRTIPFGVVVAHCNHDCEVLLHCHIDHKAAGLQDVDSTKGKGEEIKMKITI
jgi:hypothetical protein